jgi:hypothetical protein
MIRIAIALFRFIICLMKPQITEDESNSIFDERGAWMFCSWPKDARKCVLVGFDRVLSKADEDDGFGHFVGL